MGVVSHKDLGMLGTGDCVGQHGKVITYFVYCRCLCLISPHTYPVIQITGAKLLHFTAKMAKTWITLLQI